LLSNQNIFLSKQINCEIFNTMPIEYTSFKNGSATAFTRLANFAHSTSKTFSIVFMCLMMSVSVSTYAATSLKAFACAQGFGAVATGGRGGNVYHVTKLSDDGSPGTLRYGIVTTKGPRTIVFDVGGIIFLNSVLKLKTDNLTIAGQTAPGGGITLSGYPVHLRGSNVIIRYMRFRLGDYNASNPAGAGGNGNKDLSGEAGDALNVYRADRIMLDHLSVSWGMDETLDILFSTNVTLQHSIISETLFNSFHPKGRHSKGLMLLGEKSGANGKGGYTVHQNLLAHNNTRNPVVGGGADFLGLDFTNNVIYNWGTFSGHTGNPKGKVNYVNNYLIAGPDTTSKQLNTAFREQGGKDGKFYIYFAGNYMDTDKNRTHNGRRVGRDAFINFEPNELLNKAFPFPVNDSILSANGAYQNILANVGASLPRDNIDRRIINEVRNRTGGLIDSQDEIGGLNRISRGLAPIDTDADGMPDKWEKANGLNPKNASDRNKTNLSKAGYTNLEVYLDSIVASAGQCKIGGNNAKPVIIPDNNVRSSDLSGNITKKPSQSLATFSIWDASDKPVNQSEQDSGAVELGVKFMSDKDGFIEAIRFYKGIGNTGQHVGNLWTNTGKLLASATFTGETNSGWQQVNFAKPVAINKETVYVASYYAPNGHYANDDYVFKRSGVDNAPLHLLQSGVSGKNGVYGYGSKSNIPSSNWLHTNYWVDVVFKY
jgi:Domain of unknown function (DUF4082)